jgi:hypothetical protein
VLAVLAFAVIMLDFLVLKILTRAGMRIEKRATKPDMLKYGNTDISGTFRCPR